MLFLKKNLPVLLLWVILISWGCGREKSRTPPVEFAALSKEDRRLPENALASMQTTDGVRAALFAAEPLLTNPTNMAVDARGRVWICEANNYRLPYNPTFEERPAGDRILILEDSDGNGRADHSKVFYQGPEINAALGISVLGNRVIISHSPNIFVFTDEDGDDKSKVKAVEAIDQSLMTANLQAVMSAQDLIDLVEYLASLKNAEEG